MTLLYPDVSNNNWRSATDLYNFLSDLKAQGYAGVAHKFSEGNYYEDPFGSLCSDWCTENGLPFIGYHYVTTNDPGEQAQTWLDAGGADIAMFDFEANSGDLNNFWNVVTAFNAVGISVQLSYIPRWYWSQIGSPDLSDLDSSGILLVSSAYPDGRGYGSVIYDNAGGDAGQGWNSYGGASPSAWQFTDAATIDPSWSVDANAYKGTDIGVLFGTTTPTPTPAPAPAPTPAPAPSPTGGTVTADDIAQDLEGTSAGTPNWWDYVLGRADLTAQQLVDDPNRGPWNNTTGPDQLPAAVGEIDGKRGTHNHLDHSVLSAEAVSWRYWDSAGNHVDLPTLLMTWAEYTIAKDPTGYAQALAVARNSHAPAQAELREPIPDRAQLARERHQRRQLPQEPLQQSRVSRLGAQGIKVTRVEKPSDPQEQP